MRVLTLLSLLLLAVPALAASPEPSPAAMQVYEEGKRRYDAKDYAGALEQFDRCAAMEPQVARWQYNRGLALKKLKRDGEAISALRQSRALDPDYKVREIAEKLAELGASEAPPTTPDQPSSSSGAPGTEAPASAQPAAKGDFLACALLGGIVLAVLFAFGWVLRAVVRAVTGGVGRNSTAAARGSGGPAVDAAQRDALLRRSQELAQRLAKVEHGLALGEDAELRTLADRAATNLRAAYRTASRQGLSSAQAQSAAQGLVRAAEAVAQAEARLGTLRGAAGQTALGERRGCFFCARPLPTPACRHAVAWQDGGQAVTVEACATCAQTARAGRAPPVVMVGGQHWSQVRDFDPYVHAYVPPAGAHETPAWRVGQAALAAGGLAAGVAAGAVLLDLAAARESGLAAEATAAAALSAGHRRRESSGSDSWRDNS